MQFINPDDLPEGFIAQIQQQLHEHADRHIMMHEVEGHMFSQLLEDLSEDQLHALARMIAKTEGQNSAYFYGRIAQKLEDKWGHCTGCGHKHTDTGDIPEEPVGEPAKMPSEYVADSDDTLTRVAEADASRDWSEVMDIVEAYGLKVMTTIAGAQTPAYLMCENCEMPYQSLADRMRRPVGVKGCEGCQNKARWG